MSKFEIIKQEKDRIVVLKYVRIAKNSSLGKYIYLYSDNKVYKYKLQTIKE